MAQVVVAALRVAVVALALAACSDGSDDRPTDVAGLLRPGRVVVVGELHGTNEWPATIADAAAAHDGALWIGLEIPRGEQARIDAFLGSDGGDDARAALLDGRFWSYDDGRASVAMLDLLDRVRALRADGSDVEVGAFDVDTANSATGRDAGMADAIAAAVREDRASLVLVGSLHAVVGEPAFEVEPGYQPMAAVLVDRGVDVLALDTRSGGGDAWNCTADDCGVHPHPGEDRGDTQFVEVGEEPEDGYHGFVYVPSITAARPARAGG